MAFNTLRRTLKSAITLFLCAAESYAQSSRVTKDIFVDNGGHKLHIAIQAPIVVTPGIPTVVFEGGLGGGGGTWSAVIERLSPSLRIVTYDRPGLGKSEPDGAAPTPEHVAAVLHGALSSVAPPPYVLVGHSWGGPLIRSLAGIYPSEVVGLVFVDPTDFTETVLGRNRYVFGPLGHAKDGEEIRARIEEYFHKQAGEFPAAAQAEIDVSRKAREDGFSSFAHLPMPAVPLVILLTTNWPKDFPSDLSVPFDSGEYLDLVLNYRILSLSAFSRSVPEGSLVTTPTSGHYIQVDEPDLVAWAIGRVLHLSRDAKASALKAD